MTTASTEASQPSSRRLLVTGGAGFIGSNFVHHWVKRYPSDRLVVIDALTYAGNRENLAGLDQLSNFRFVQGDICDRPGHDRRYAIDASKMRRSLGWVPQETLASGLRQTVQWYLANHAWWRSLLPDDYPA